MRVIILVLILASIVGCAANGNKFETMKYVKNPEKTEILVFREKKFTSGGACFNPVLDGVKLGILANGGFLRAEIEPGTHELLVPMPWQNSIKIPFESKANETIYFEVSVTLNGKADVPEEYRIGEYNHYNLAQGALMQIHHEIFQLTPNYALKKISKLKDSSNSNSCLSKIN